MRVAFTDLASFGPRTPVGAAIRLARPSVTSRCHRLSMRVVRTRCALPTLGRMRSRFVPSLRSPERVSWSRAPKQLANSARWCRVAWVIPLVSRVAICFARTAPCDGARARHCGAYPALRRRDRLSCTMHARHEHRAGAFGTLRVSHGAILCAKSPRIDRGRLSRVGAEAERATARPTRSLDARESIARYASPSRSSRHGTDSSIRSARARAGHVERRAQMRESCTPRPHRRM